MPKWNIALEHSFELLCCSQSPTLTCIAACSGPSSCSPVWSLGDSSFTTTQASSLSPPSRPPWTPWCLYLRWKKCFQQKTNNYIAVSIQVLFPSVVVCNINQIRKSLFNELGFYDNETLVRIMYEDFIKGTKDNSENSTYLGSEFEDDEHHTIKRKEFYQVTRHSFLLSNVY